MTSRGTLVSSRRRTVAVLALAALALTACSANPSGAASVVGSTSISDRDVASAVDEVRTQLSEVRGGPAFDDGAATAAVLQNMTRHLILDEAAGREGIVVTQGQVDTFLDTIVSGQFKGDRAALEQQLASQSTIPASQIDQAARDNLVFTALVTKLAPGGDQTAQAKAVNDYMTALDKELDVRVAPRFGTWKVFSLGPVGDDLSRPAPVGSGSPAPGQTDGGVTPSPSPSAS